ncbi:hypothetical protein, partial [Halorubrum yunnanense]
GALVLFDSTATAQQYQQSPTEERRLNVQVSGNEFLVEFPNKSKYKSIHEEVHEAKGHLDSDLRKMNFEGIESAESVSESDEIRDPKNIEEKVEKKNVYSLIGGLNIEIEEFAVFGNGSIIKIPILST